MEPYKLKAEIKDFILQKAREHPELGCRKLAGLIQEAFQANISKSTISSVLKSSGLNKAVGRRSIASPQAGEEAVRTQESLRGAIATKQSLRLLRFARNDETLPKAEQLPAENQESQECGNWFLKAAELCLGEIESTKAAVPQLFSDLVSRSTEALSLKFILEDNSFFFLDAGCHSVWTTERIPQRLSVGLHKTRTHINECILSGRRPLILQAAPGFDAPTPAFLDFIDAFQADKPDKAIMSIELYSTDNLLIDTIKLTPSQEKRYFIIGLWPWQYKNRDFSLPIRLLFINGTDNRKKLDIITNLESDRQDKEEIIGHYLSHWPNLELGYQDFLDEIGHLIRSPGIQNKAKCPIIPSNGENLTYEQLINFWRLILNSYCQRHFFPLSYQELDFLVLQERFYHLRCTINPAAGAFGVKFEPPEDFPYLKDLQYTCQRVNEADIRLGDGRKLRFQVEI